MFPALPLPRHLLPWILFGVSLLGMLLGALLGVGPLLGLGILGAVVAGFALLGTRLLGAGDDDHETF